jgi:hypothetical protein
MTSAMRIASCDEPKSRVLNQLAPSKPTASREPFNARRKKKIVLASRCRAG